MIGLLLAAAIAPATDSRCKAIRTNDLIECAAAELKAADGALNRQWKKAQAKVKSQGPSTAADRASNDGLSFSQSLMASQRAWLSYRDAQCRFKTYRNVGGREYRIYKLGCLAYLTNQRVKELTDFNEGQ